VLARDSLKVDYIGQLKCFHMPLSPSSQTDETATVPQAVRGGTLMSLAMLCFVLNDTIAKTLAGQIAVGEFILVRGLFASAIIAALIIFMGKTRDMSKALSKQVLTRSFFDVISTFLFVIALFHLPLPNITAVMQAVPLVVTLMAAAFLGEAVGWKRLSAILIGFAGVLLIVKPGSSGFNSYIWLALACVFTVAIRDLATRKLNTKVPSIIVAFTNSVCVMLGGLVWGAFEGFDPLSAQQLGWIALGSVFLVGGYLFTVMSLRDTEVAYTAPFRYTLIVYALILGYVVFGDVPDSWSLFGIVLIVGSGLFTLYREQRLKKRIGFGKRLVR
jgi:drug/metabolite transporter (DMT)-like permease